MEKLRGIVTAVTGHRAFFPALVAIVALTLGILFAFEHSRNLLKVRGPYLVVLGAILVSYFGLQRRAWQQGADLFAAASCTGEVETAMAAGRSMCQAYDVPEDPVLSWWRDRLGRP